MYLNIFLAHTDNGVQCVTSKHRIAISVKLLSPPGQGYLKCFIQSKWTCLFEIKPFCDYIAMNTRNAVPLLT